MNFKGWFLIGSGIVFLAIAAFMIFYLRQAAAEATNTERLLRTGSDCEAKRLEAIQMVMDRNREREAPSRVTGSAAHYNRMLEMCYVEVSTYESGASPILMKTLISPSENAAVLWSATGAIGDVGRRCFNRDATILNCDEADKRWKTFMTE
jgi:hypothetical protein